MEYQNSKHVPGGASAAAAKRIVDTLSAVGFRIVSQQNFSVELKGPGMNSSRENALVGASRVVVRVERGQVTVEAEFAAVRRLIRGVGVLVGGLAIFFLVLFGFIVPVKESDTFVRFVMPILPVALWPIVLPWMGRVFRRRTARALDALLQDADTR
jgi:hypothetical protein